MTSDAESKLVDTVPLEDSHNNEDGMMVDFYINAHHDLDTKDTPPKKSGKLSILHLSFFPLLV